MGSITLSLPEELVEAAYVSAEKKRASLDDLLREWLDNYVKYGTNRPK